MLEFNRNGIYSLNFLYGNACQNVMENEMQRFIYLFIMEIGVGNPIENEIPLPFLCVNIGI